MQVIDGRMHYSPVALWCFSNWLWSKARRCIITKAENYMPRFPISSGAALALASLFTSVQHSLEMYVHYLVTLSYKPVQQSQIHNRWLHCISAGQCFYNDMRFALRVKARTAAHRSAYNSQPWLSSLPFNLALKYVIRRVQGNSRFGIEWETSAVCLCWERQYTEGAKKCIHTLKGDSLSN